MFLKRLLYSRVAEKRAVRQHDGSATTGFQEADDESQKKVRRFAGLEMLGEVALNAVLFPTAEGRIGKDDVNAVAGCVADIGPGQCIVVAHETRILNPMQQHVGDAE